ncbi:ricin-type beta-trefoil lectin domain protein [Streptomyces sp. NPDC007088]|uniref:ricin-type beta-trefoil lectin domain protein n=1 Tax=Streptomyces sp. NPDC007088 TaxID=3364773 RepID=UPI0036B61A69
MADAFHAGVRAADAGGWIKAPVQQGAAVRSGIAGKCLDVKAAGAASGTAAQIWSCNGSDAQAWSARTDETLRSLGKCLDATGRGTANGTKIQMWDCDGGGNQVGQPYEGGDRNPASGRCLDDPAGSTTDAAQLVLRGCNGAANQKWTTPAAS